MFFIEDIFLHGTSAAGGNPGAGQEYPFFFQSCHCGIGADLAQPHRCCYLRARGTARLLHVTLDSGFGIHTLVKHLKKV